MKNLLMLCLFVSFFSACGTNESSGIPRPKGYYRIAFPTHAYVVYNDTCPFTFEHPIYSSIIFRGDYRSKCWPDIYFQSYKANLHLSYSPVKNNLIQILEDSRTLTYKHTVKANDITEQYIDFRDKRVFGTLYSISGNAASAIQFHLTDSSNHFIRGSLYFNTSPNADSLAPVIEFLSKDVEHLIQTFKWK